MTEFKRALANRDTAYYLFKDPVGLYNCGRLAELGLHNMGLARSYYRRYLAVAEPKTAEEKRAYRFVKERWGGGRGGKR
jgi:hypothetical protein